MPTGIDRLLSSSFGLKLAVGIARTTPTRLGYSIADSIARWIARRGDLPLVRAVRGNQWFISGKKKSGQALDHSVLATIRYSAASIFELYHFLGKALRTESMYTVDQEFQRIINRPEYDQRGLVIAGLHMTGFDLGLQWLGAHGLRALILTIPDPQGGRRFEMETRQLSGMKLLPGSLTSLRQALRQLQKGGTVMTGIDHPDLGSSSHPRFFGQQSVLPVHHIYLAQKTQTPVVIAASRQVGKGRYELHASPPIEMDPHPDREKRLVLNAEKVLRVAESFIREAPEQWIISLPVWTNILSEVPA